MGRRSHFDIGSHCHMNGTNEGFLPFKFNFSKNDDHHVCLEFAFSKAMNVGLHGTHVACTLGIKESVVFL